MVSGGGSSGVEKVSVDVAGGVVPVDGEEDRGAQGLGAVPSLSDEEWLSGGGDAVHLEVDLADSVGRSGPRAGNSDSAWWLGVGGLNAGEALDVSGGVLLGIGGVGDHLDGGGVGGPHSDVGVDSLHEDVINGVGGEVGDLGGVGVHQSEVDHS